MGKTKRRGISKTLRMEVFKRDAFKCVYCGKKPEDGAVLEIDHLTPVAKGGKDDIFNLVTSCLDCNRGKGAKELSDQTALEKQRNEMERLNKRLNHLKGLKQWRDELSKLEDSEIDFFVSEMEAAYNVSLTELGIKKAKKMVRKYTLEMCVSLISELPVEKIPEEYKGRCIEYMEKCLAIKASRRKSHILKTYFTSEKYCLTISTLTGTKKPKSQGR